MAAIVVDQIDQMRALAAVVASGSFTAAAARLGMTPQLVSKYVKALEDDLDVRLLNRTTRKVQLTDSGRAFYLRAERLIEGFDELRAAVRAEHTTPSGHLRVTAPITFGERHLVGIAAQFLEAYPQTTVDLHLTDRFVSLIDDGYDVAIRISELEDSSLIARKLVPFPLVVCATPTYLERAGIPKQPNALAEHCCVVDTNVRRGDHWSFVVDGRRTTVRVQGRFRANSPNAVREVVLRDGGIALCPAFIVGDDLRSGRVVELFQAYNAYDLAVFAVYLESRHLAAKVRVFLDFVGAQLKTQLAS